MIRILVADDHTLFREGLKKVLEAERNMEVVGEASNGQETLEKAKETRPDIVLLDVSMPGRGGLETAQDLKKRVPGTRILMLSAHPEDHYAIRCLKGGADGYMTKDQAAERLIHAITKIRTGGKYVSSTLAEQMAFSLETELGRPPHESLSDREFQVMRMIASGQTVSEIGVELCLSVKTVSTYRARILQKMKFRNNAEIMQYALKQSLVE
jgi:DNA-binding NarL/FixJ family response regulator